MKKIIKKHWLFTIFISVFFLALAFKITTSPTPFYDWDESLYIQTGMEMYSNNYFLFPVWQGEIWMDKPPLIPLTYATVAKLFFFISPEISTRLFTLAISTVALTFLYMLYQKLLKDNFLTILTLLITVTTPIFLQRTQVVNLDLFLLLGWLGYLLFFKNKFASFFFLFIAVMSKSLIGFYPAFMMAGFYVFQFIRHKIKKEELKSALIQIAIQVSILSLWFVAMFALYGSEFFTTHIVESHLRRVTSSIEFHFGERLYYINLAREQLGIFFWLSLVGLVAAIHKYFNREKELFKSFYLLPWFLFLNLTKTKIFWYFFAAVPQFGFLAILPLTYLKKGKKLYHLALILITTILIYQSFIKQKVFATVYSKQEPYLELSLYAKERCRSLYVLQDAQTRSSFAELEDLGLLISTTKWWGSHPSMVYYFGRTIYFLYSEIELENENKNIAIGDCLAINNEDKALITDDSFTPLKTFGSDILFSKQ